MITRIVGYERIKGQDGSDLPPVPGVGPIRSINAATIGGIYTLLVERDDPMGYVRVYAASADGWVEVAGVPA